MLIQVYRAILGLEDDQPVNEMYQASAGLLLDPQIRKMFDNLDLSFHFNVSTSLHKPHTGREV